MAGTIGLKIANGQFYPILTEKDTAVKKRLVLTTVHDGQNNVQIDLFRSLSKSMIDAQYIGSLVVEDISPKMKGDPSIEMIISCDPEGNISAEAHDLDASGTGSGGGRRTLNVSLQSLASSGRTSGGFDFEPLYTDKGRYSKKEKSNSPALILGVAALFVVLGAAALWLLFFNPRGADPLAREFVPSEWASPPPAPPAPAAAPPAPPPAAAQPLAPEPAPPPPAPVPASRQPEVIRAPAAPPPARPQTARTRPPAPVSSYRVPAVIPNGGAPYQIRWGDTLWDISEAFYRDPWLYPRIARFNNIPNPDLIIAGRTIRIPPRN